jgi:hypothetical protein
MVPAEILALDWPLDQNLRNIMRMTTSGVVVAVAAELGIAHQLENGEKDNSQLAAPVCADK